MKVEEILRAKGKKVLTVQPNAPIILVIRRLKMEDIGAMVVSQDGEHVLGMISERDVVRALVDRGASVLDLRVGHLMSRSAATCGLQDKVQDVMAQMTRRRVRHLPVVDQGRLCGILSIGDAVKSRLDELQLEANVLRDAYIACR
jgi:signal-transduction protein with cAMP-binding, CBS, and nucleotidyltransferase domain